MGRSGSVVGSLVALLLPAVLAEMSTNGPQTTVRFRESCDEFHFPDRHNEKAKLCPSGHYQNPERWGCGIHALSEDVVFVYGCLSTGAYSVRSVLLRSDDGGQSWRETGMVPEIGSAVFRLLFLDEKVGWAEVGWTVEGRGDTFLLRTTDGGRNWKKLGVVLEGGTDSSWLVRLKFYDASHGQAIVFHDHESAPSDGIEIRETVDGGRSWERVLRIELGMISGSRYCIESGEKRPIGLVTSEMCRQIADQLRDGPQAVACAPDGSQWRMCVVP